MCSPDPDERCFQYTGPIYIRPLMRGIVLGESGDLNAPYIDDALSVMVDELAGDDTYVCGSDKFDATVHITVRRRV